MLHRYQNISGSGRNTYIYMYFHDIKQEMRSVTDKLKLEGYKRPVIAFISYPVKTLEDRLEIETVRKPMI